MKIITIASTVPWEISEISHRYPDKHLTLIANDG